RKIIFLKNRGCQKKLATFFMGITYFRSESILRIFSTDIKAGMVIPVQIVSKPDYTLQIIITGIFPGECIGYQQAFRILVPYYLFILYFATFGYKLGVKQTA